MWPVTLSGRLPIVALVSRYFTNKLIGHEPLLKRKLASEAIFGATPSSIALHGVLAPLSGSYPPLKGRLSMHYSPVRHSTKSPKASFSFDLHA